MYEDHRPPERDLGVSFLFVSLGKRVGSTIISSSIFQKRMDIRLGNIHVVHNYSLARFEYEMNDSLSQSLTDSLTGHLA